MNKDDHQRTGSLLRSFGAKGEVILKFENDLPEKIKKLESIFIVVDGKLVPFFIDTIREKSINTAVVKLEGIDREEKVREYIGAAFYLSKQQIQQIAYTVDEYPDVAGYEVINQHNQHVGRVVEFIDIPGNPLLKVQTPASEILIPANDELIIEVDDDLRHILMHIIDGLSDMD
ncbi:MAG: ribosome maturation factor RimM [Bacteroidales bacterium]|jgi:16S rRNA processing protein RimM|nr:ribosome maturation factor RimM [Bacteroidales bacterium]